MSETFLIKLEPKASNFIKKSLWHKCFPLNFAKFLRTTFLQNTSGTASVLVLSVAIIWILFTQFVIFNP